MLNNIYINIDTAIDLHWIIQKRIEQLKNRMKKIYESKKDTGYKLDKDEIARLKKLQKDIDINFKFSF